MQNQKMQNQKNQKIGDKSEMSRRKKSIIAAVVFVLVILLLIGSFFLRDIMLRAGIAEFERDEILQVNSKYSTTLKKIAEQGSLATFVITAEHKGLFDKSEISCDNDKAKSIYSDLKEEVDVLCHNYCYKISGSGKAVYFDFNKAGTRQLIYSAIQPEKQDENDVLELLGDDWYYYEMN